MNGETPKLQEEHNLIPVEVNPWWWLLHYYGPHEYNPDRITMEHLGISDYEFDPIFLRNRKLWNSIQLVTCKENQIDELDRIMSDHPDKFLTKDELSKLSNEELEKIKVNCIKQSENYINDIENKSQNSALEKLKRQHFEHARKEFDLHSWSVDFTNNIFKNCTNFEGYVFAKEFSANGCSFEYDVVFDDCYFLRDCSFYRNTFKTYVFFKRSIFYESASFFKSSFYIFDFSSAIFRGSADFEGVEYQSISTFEGAVFEASSYFNNVPFEDAVDFYEVEFHHPPYFHEAKLHQGINWDAKFWGRWPPEDLRTLNNCSDKIHKEASEWEMAWSTLKLHMNAQQKHNLEHLFFSKELEVKRWRLKQGKGHYFQRIAYFLYEKWSDYGGSIGRPFGWLIDLIIPFAILYGGIEYLTSNVSWNDWSIWYEGLDALKISIANSLPILGLHRYVLTTDTSVWTFALSAFHSLVSLILLFLLGLGLRNKFRIK